MRVKTFLGRRAAVVVVVAIVALGISACAPAAPTTSAGPSDSFTSSLLQRLNADRAANGLPALSWSPLLGDSASAWARQMGAANSLYHQNLSALITSPAYAGYSSLGENILQGVPGSTAAAAESLWMSSAPHRANILSGGFNVVGIGYYWGSDGRLWAVQDFGRI